MTNEKLFEGFWDGLVTKAKQGMYAAAGALGSGAAKGKLTASLLSTAMFDQWKEWSESTGSELSKKDFAQFMGKMGFSPEFTATEVAELGKFVAPTASPAPDAQTHDGADAAEASDAEAPKSADDHLAAAAQKAKDEREAQQPKSNDQRIKDQIATKNKFQAKRATRESINEDVVQDSELRKFFDQLAKRALKSGEAKSAAQKTIEINRTNSGEQQQSQPAPDQAPAQTQTPEPNTQAAPVQRQEKPAAPAAAQPAAAPAQPAPAQPAPVQPQPAAQTAAPAGPPPPGSDIQLSDGEKEIMDAFPVGTNLGSQITATDPEVQQLARKVLQSAFNDYKKRTPVPAPKAKAPAKPKAAPAPAAAQPAAATTPPATPPAAPAA